VALRAILEHSTNTPVYSVANLWEVVVKSALRRPDFQVDPVELRRLARANGWEELPITGEHSLAVAGLPLLHKDPFDRILVAQAIAEGIDLLTADAQLARYGAPVRLV
jgi:PIN domain nuclease of toxin-antitoxin system